MQWRETPVCTRIVCSSSSLQGYSSLSNPDPGFSTGVILFPNYWRNRNYRPAISSWSGEGTSKSEVFTPLRSSPTFGYTKEKLPHTVGSWLHDVRRGVSWWRPVETSRGDVMRAVPSSSSGDVSWEGGRGRPYYASGPSPRGGLGGRLRGGSRWTCPHERVWGGLS